ncbi:MAG: efflux transporter outer membrane subunit [Pseudomonadota bacterium]|jgi:NodT family efflux transporter outer membrane factor (OMF) lipoprotein
MAWLAAMPLLGGCAVGPDYVRPALELPVRWSDTKPAGTTAPARLGAWWRRLDDPLLDRLVVAAVEDNFDVAAARARIREARALRKQAVGALLPSVNGSGLGNANRSAAGADLGATTFNQFQAGLDASWELDLFGGNRRAVEAATYGTEAAEDDLRATLVTLIGDVAAAYVDARGSQARAALARRAATSQRETAALTRRKVEAGSTGSADLEKALALAASTEAAIPSHEAAQAEAVHRIGVLLGRDPTALAPQLAVAGRIPAPRLPLPKGIPADVLQMRPDVRRAEWQLALHTAKIGQAEAALYPSVSLTGSVSTTALKIGDLGRSSTIGWSIGPTLSVPIFNGGKLRAAVEIAQAQRDQRVAAWRGAVLAALGDVETSTVALAQERIRGRGLAEAARRYQVSLRLSRALYETGSASFLDVLDAERSQFSAEDALLQSRVAVAKDFIALAKALGGGWDGAIDSTTPDIVDLNTGPRPALQF